MIDLVGLIDPSFDLLINDEFGIVGSRGRDGGGIGGGRASGGGRGGAPPSLPVSPLLSIGAVLRHQSRS